MKQKVTVFTSPWHVHVSNAFFKIFIDPLSRWIDFQIEKIDENFNDGTLSAHPDGPLVFLMDVPPSSWLERSADRMVWVPMADALPSESSGFWECVPKSLRIVALSDVVHEMAKRYQLPCFFTRFFLDPMNYDEVDWSTGRVAYYWNRRGLVSSWFLRRFCRELEIDRLLFRADIDPGVSPSHAFQLPSRIGSTKVEKVEWMERPEDYAKRVASANIVILPRPNEGVGMTMIEAMARGACTIGYNASTMNEYVQNGRNGVLLTWCSTPNFRTLALRVGVKACEAIRLDRTDFGLKRKAVSPFQDWQMLSNADFQRLGDRAREDHITGAQAWNNSLPLLVSFLLHHSESSGQSVLA